MKPNSCEINFRKYPVSFSPKRLNTLAVTKVSLTFFYKKCCSLYCKNTVFL